MIIPMRSSTVIVTIFACLSTTLAFGADLSPPRLMGIVVGPNSREAVFNDPARANNVVILPEGAAIGVFTIKSIANFMVTIAGPSGLRTLSLDDEHAAPVQRAVGAAAPIAVLGQLGAETTESGAIIGLLALRRDQCAHAGLLPDASTDAEQKLNAMIDAMANLPAREGLEAKYNAPTRLLASALSAGLAQAKRKSVGVLDRPVCVLVNARWNATAGRYGLL